MLTQPPPAPEMHARPNCAPPYYQGRPATLWITIMNPQTKRTAAGRARTTRHPAPVPRPRPPQAGVTIPPAPRLSAVYRTPRPRRSASPVNRPAHSRRYT